MRAQTTSNLLSLSQLLGVRYEHKGGAPSCSLLMGGGPTVRDTKHVRQNSHYNVCLSALLNAS